MAYHRLRPGQNCADAHLELYGVRAGLASNVCDVLAVDMLHLSILRDPSENPDLLCCLQHEMIGVLS